MKIKPLAITMMIATLLIPSAIAAPPPEQAQALSFDLLKKTVIKAGPGSDAAADEDRKMVFPEALKKLEGKRVILTGFVAPYDDPDKMTKMMVFKTATGCFFCNPPDENELVFVRMAAKEKPMRMDSETVRVEGILRLNDPATKDQEIKQFCFTIDEAKVTAVDTRKGG